MGGEIISAQMQVSMAIPTTLGSIVASFPGPPSFRTMHDNNDLLELRPGYNYTIVESSRLALAIIIICIICSGYIIIKLDD